MICSQLTEVNIVESTVEVSSMASLQTSAQTKVTQLDVPLSKEKTSLRDREGERGRKKAGKRERKRERERERERDSL